MSPRIESLTSPSGDVCVYYDDKLVARIEETNGLWYAHYYTQGYTYNGTALTRRWPITENDAKELFAALL